MELDMATKQKIELAVTEILRSSDIDAVSESQVRAMVATKLGLDLSDLPHKIFVREVIESFLLSTPSPEEILRRIAAATSEIANSGDSNELTLREVLDIVRAKVGIDFFVSPYCDVVRQVIISLYESSSGNEVPSMANDAVEGEEEMKRRVEGALPEIMQSCDMKMRDVLAMVRVMDRDRDRDRDSFLTSAVVHHETAEEEDSRPVIAPPTKQNLAANDSCRVICKLSNKRDVAVKGSGDDTVVSLRELLWKDGKQMPSRIGICLSNDQWSIFRNNVPAIEEAIRKVDSRTRLEHERKQADEKHNRSHHESKQNDDTQSRAGLTQNGIHHRHRLVATGKHSEEAKNMCTTPRGIVPISIIRLDGKNYPQWVDRMESYLNNLKIAYVLSDPCPSTVGVMDRELGRTLSAIQKWVDDDHICRQNILNSLCDILFGHYSEKKGTARDLWEELKLVYLNEEYGTKVSGVKKYIEFQMIEDKPIFEQVQELHEIADSLIASGMYVEEKFHVNVIISKLPPSWKPFSIQLMKEDYLPVWMLMNLLKAKDESRGKGGKGEAFFQCSEVPMSQNRFGPMRAPMKKFGVPSSNHEIDRDRRIKFCTGCKKKGHVLEQCWSRRSGGKNSTSSDNENNKLINDVAGRNIDSTIE